MRSKLAIVLGLLLMLVAFSIATAEEDPFAGGADALAVNASDGSSSLRAKLKLKKMGPDMIMVQVSGVNDKQFPQCVVKARVLKTAKMKDKHFKLIGRGKTYRFMAALKQKRGKLDLKDPMTRQNLGMCYYPKRTKLILKVTGVNRKEKAFTVAESYVK